jgi:replicative DNA helicase
MQGSGAPHHVGGSGGADSHLTPQNLEAEEAVLGAMLINPRAIEMVDEVGLRASDFYRPSHRIIYEAIRSLAARDAVDELTVVNELRHIGKLNEAGGQIAIVSLAERVPSVANARAYAEEVLSQSVLRGLVDTGHKIAQLGYEHPDDPPALVDQAGVLVSELAQQRESADFVDMAELLNPIYDELTERAESGGKSRGLPTGFIDFDHLTGGLQPGSLVIIAARPAMGKTSWALNIAEHIALVERKPVAVFSLEMTAQDLVTRMLCSVAKVDARRIRNDVPHESDWPLLVEAIGKLNQARGLLHIDQSSSLTPLELRSKVRRLNARLKEHGGLSAIFVDYLQIMEAGRRFDNRQNEVAYMSRQLKALALELNVPIVALSQLSRQSESRGGDKRPLLSDLRDSGAIEQDADLVAFLHRPEYYDRDDPSLQGKAEIIVAKHRNGEVGAKWLGFLAKYTKFVNLATPSQHAAAGASGGAAGHAMPAPAAPAGGPGLRALPPLGAAPVGGAPTPGGPPPGVYDPGGFAPADAFGMHVPFGDGSYEDDDSVV